MRIRPAKCVYRLCKDRRGATAVEYALIASLVAGVAMGAMIAFGVSLELLFVTVSDQIVSNVSPPPDDPTRCVEVGSNCPK